MKINGELVRAWRVPFRGWLGWAAATAGSIALIAFGGVDQGVPLRTMALSLFPWLALLGICLGIIAMAGNVQRSREAGSTGH